MHLMYYHFLLSLLPFYCWRFYGMYRFSVDIASLLLRMSLTLSSNCKTAFLQWKQTNGIKRNTCLKWFTFCQRFHRRFVMDIDKSTQVSTTSGASVGTLSLNSVWWLRVISELLISPYAIARPSVVCNARAPYSGGSHFRQYFYGIRYLGHPLTSTENFTEIVPGEPLRRGS